MTKDKVIAIKGNPIQASAKDGYEYHFYNETKENNGFESNQVFVRFKDGKVDSYGPMSELKISKEPSTSFEKKKNDKYPDMKETDLDTIYGWTRLFFGKQWSEEKNQLFWLPKKSANPGNSRVYSTGGDPVNMKVTNFPEGKLPLFFNSDYLFGFMHPVNEFQDYIVIDHLTVTGHFKPYRYFIYYIEPNRRIKENTIAYHSLDSSFDIKFSGENIYSLYDKKNASGKVIDLRLFMGGRLKEMWNEQIGYLQFIMERLAAQYSEFWMSRHKKRLN